MKIEELQPGQKLLIIRYGVDIEKDCISLQPEVLREPVLALDGGPDGCDLYRRIAASAGRVLRSGGKLLMELGIRESAPVASLLAAQVFTDIRFRKDLNGIDRMILAARP